MKSATIVRPWASRAGRAVICTLLLLSTGLAALAPVGAQGQGAPGGPQSDVASYGIEVTLDAATKQLRGNERITYRNPSNDTLREVWLRLYLNAFRSPNTQWMREAGGSHRGASFEEPGWINVEEINLAGTGTPLALPGARDSEETIVRLALPTPLGPGQSLDLDVRWTAQLPRVFARTGYYEDFVMAGQWYPKLAVYDRGAWDNEPWHANAEFYADFGNYDLALTVPSGHATGASGVRQGEADNGNGMKTVRYRAERVTDVAWTAWPGFTVHSRDLQPAGVTTQVEVLLPSAESANAERHFAAARAALDAYGTWYGAYPWPKLTVVVPPPGAGGAGGMEYPTLVTTGSNALLPVDVPWIDEGVRALETVTVHEIAHEWFPMQVQSNEAREAWLDEGFADYMTTRVLDDLYGPRRSMIDVGFVEMGYLNQHRTVMASMGGTEPLAQAAWQYPSFNSYGATVYSKGSLALASLENLLGEERFTSALRDYADRWRWRHPTTADLQASLEESTGEDLDWFFSSVVYDREVVDYAVTGLERNQAVVERQGDVPFPVDVRVSFADGTSQTRRWGGDDERLVLEGGGKAIVAVAVDPEERIALEVDRLDNARALEPDRTPVLSLGGRWLALVQLLLQWLGQVG